MKKNDFKNMKAKKIEDLEKMVSEKKHELMKLLSDKSSKAEKNIKKGRNIKKEIAQILTVITEMKIIKEESKEEEK